MVFPTSRRALGLAIALVASGLAAANPQSAERETLLGMRSYFEPQRAQRDGSTVTFGLFRSGVPDAADEIARYQLNCESREVGVVGKPGDSWKVLAGEDLYPVGKKLCEWDGKGFMEKLLK